MNPLLPIVLIALSHHAQASQDFSTAGTWRGPAQFQTSPASGNDIGGLALQIDKGEVKGASENGGCRIEGTSTPHHIPTVLQLEIEVSACEDSRLNRRYTGIFSLYRADGRARLRLQSGHGGGPVVLNATMARAEGTAGAKARVAARAEGQFGN